MKHLLALNLFLIWLPFSSLGQSLAQKEQAAVQALSALRSANNDEQISTLHLAFKKAMSELVRSKDFFDLPLQQLKIADIKSTDQTVRLLTWNVELSDLSYTYGGFVLRREEGKDRVQVLELTDILDAYNTKPEGIVDHKSWYGAVYYKIIDFSFQGKTQYLLFGYDGGTTMSNYKILDVLSFSGQVAKFGSPVFKDPKGIKKELFSSTPIWPVCLWNSNRNAPASFLTISRQRLLHLKALLRITFQICPTMPMFTTTIVNYGNSSPM